TAFTTALVTSGSDSSSATITIDNASPADVTSPNGTAGDAQVTLVWTNPVDSDFDSVLVLRSLASITDVPTEGATYLVDDTLGASSVRYVSNNTTFNDVALTNGTAYHYQIFSKDTHGNYS